jgi:cell division protein FtsQ
MKHWPTSPRRPVRSGRERRLLPTFGTLLRVIVLASFVMAGVWAWHWLKRPNVLPITHIAIQADYQHIKKDVLETTVAPYLAAGFFQLNIMELQQALLAMPWIATASINRIWPNKILITITERQAVARWKGDALLDKKGAIFKPAVASFPTGLPLLNGMDEEAVKIWQYYQEMTTALTPLSLRIVELDLTPRQSWSLVLNNGARIFLGRLDVLQRLNHFIKLYPKLFAARSNILESVDLRYPNGMSIRWRDGVESSH